MIKHKTNLRHYDLKEGESVEIAGEDSNRLSLSYNLSGDGLLAAALQTFDTADVRISTDGVSDVNYNAVSVLERTIKHAVDGYTVTCVRLPSDAGGNKPLSIGLDVCEVVKK